MVLISIDPFALRRLLLVIVAVAGFSALCFADPVMMAQRYRYDRGQLVATKIEANTQIAPRSSLVSSAPAQPCFWRANPYGGTVGLSSFLDIDYD